MHHYLVQLVIILKLPVRTDFIVYPQPDDHGYGHPRRQSGYVHQGIELILQEIPPGDCEVVFPHNPKVVAERPDVASAPPNFRYCTGCLMTTHEKIAFKMKLKHIGPWGSSKRRCMEGNWRHMRVSLKRSNRSRPTRSAIRQAPGLLSGAQVSPFS